MLTFRINLRVCVPVKVVHQLLVAQGLLADDEDVTQVVVSLRVTSATLPDLSLMRSQRRHYEGFVRLQGVVLGITATVTYTRRFKCTHCFMALKEVKSQRTLSDDLCQFVKLGQRYEMVGTQRMNFEAENIACMFEVNNMTAVDYSLMRPLDSNGAVTMLPASVRCLYARWGNVSLVFPHLMALKLADQVIPKSCFFKLKLLLLISLVLPPEVSRLHVLAVSSETHLVHRLLEFCASLGSHSIRHSCLSTLGAKASASRFPWSPYFIQAGSLVLASHGVCTVGDLQGLKRADRLELQAALSEGRVLVTLEAKHTGGLPHVVTLPLSCQVWAHTLLNTANNGSSSITDLPPALFDAFSVVCQCDTGDTASVDITEALVFSTLASSMSYIAVARQQKSVMTVEAEWLLTSYLIAARHARSHASSSTASSALPVSAMHTLQSLAHGLCKLSLHHDVTETDALMAIFLYEESLSARLGVSGLCVFPEPHLPAFSAETFITTQMPTTMRKFHSRLLSFCSGASVTATSEE
ncbi:hypothetical protein BaRGS_00008175 [Batillaria attramentaria]|uniref:Uncharacterized protein n=1 Tax=Batillaria attramentaria TaxID=370345 RepID=A0ABD0LM58_9CAEN